MTFKIGDTVREPGGPPKRVVGLLTWPSPLVGCALLPLDPVRVDFVWHQPDELEKV